MTIKSMTGFARGHGVSGCYSWAWELRSVNAKGLELRLRLPPGWDPVEAPVRAIGARMLARGTVYGTLTVGRQGVAPIVRVNEPVLARYMANTVGMVTALNPVLGYDRATELAQEAYRSGKGLIEVIREQGALNEDQIRDILDPVKLANLDRSKYQRDAQNQQNK